MVYHKVGRSSAKVLPDFSMRLMMRNRLRFVERFYPDRIRAARRQLWRDCLWYLLKRRFGTASIVFGVLRGASGKVVNELPR